MTTPVKPDAPQPVAAPPLRDTAGAFFEQDDTALAKEWGIAEPVAEINEEVSPYKEAVEPKPLSAPETIPTDSEGAEAAPTNEVEIPAAQRTLMTEFKVLDGEGELEIPEIQIEFKAKGEMRKLPLDHVVRLAQFGFANEEREQQVLAAKRFVTEAQTKEEQYQQLVNQYEGYYDRMFNDPAFYEEARLAYLNQNTPEVRAQRAETELRLVRQGRQQDQESSAVAQFVQQTLTPAVSRLITENPLVNEAEVIGHWTRLTAPLLQNGRVALSRLPEVERLAANELSTWVQQLQVERTLNQRATQQVVDAKRQTGRVFAQPGRVPDTTPKPTKFDSARSWLDATFPAPSE